MPTLAVLILNYYGSSDTVECVRSVQQSTLSKDWSLRVIVGNISDAERADSAREERDFLLQQLSRIEVVDLPNLGFAGGNNVLLQKAKQDTSAEVFILLNNDTTVSSKAVQRLAEEVKSADVIVSPKILFSAGKEFHRASYEPKERGSVLWYAGGVVDQENIYAWHRGVDEVDFGQHDESGLTDFATGCCLAISRKTQEKIGMLDESYFMYLEDLDFCRRAQARGVSSRYLPEAVIWHKNAGSTSGAGSDFHVYYQTRNRLLYGMRWGSWRTRRALLREAQKMLENGTLVQKRAVLDWKQQRLGKRKGGM